MIEFARVECDPASLSDIELRGAISACGRLRSRIEAAEAALLAEVARRPSMVEGAAGTAARSQGVSRREAKRRADVAKGLSGLSTAGAALRSGRITGEHARALAQAARRHRAEVAANESQLVGLAADQTPEEFTKTMRQFSRDVEGDDGTSEFERLRRRRAATVFTRADDGMTVLHAELDPLVGARVRGVLAHLAEALWRHDHRRGPAPSLDRTPPQRMADALDAVFQRVGTAQGLAVAGPEGSSGLDAPNERGSASRSGAAPAGPASPPRATGFPPATVMVVADHARLLALLTEKGRCGLSDGTALPVETVRRMACDADILPAIFAADGQPLYVGRKSRLATPGQRAAVVARDGTCVGCDAPADWCQIHHIEWWRDGGGTDIDNLCLVCSRHHHLVHEGGWTIGRDPDGRYRLRSPARAPAPQR